VKTATICRQIMAIVLMLYSGTWMIRTSMDGQKSSNHQKILKRKIHIKGISLGTEGKVRTNEDFELHTSSNYPRPTLLQQPYISLYKHKAW
jgi:hypothetical protein